MKKFLIVLLSLMVIAPITVFAQRTAVQPAAPVNHQLTVAVNPAGAAIFIDGAQIKGNVATVTAGMHTVMTRAAGYVDFSTSVNVSGPMTLPITMQPLTYALSVNASNVKGAQVVLNGSTVGIAPFATQLPGGGYTVTLQAPGFMPYTESFTMSGPKSINVALQPAMGMLQIQLPASAINTDMKGGHWSQIQVYIDGAPQKGQTFQVPPGRHLVKITSGGLQVETYVDIVAGGSYRLEPFMGLNLK